MANRFIQTLLALLIGLQPLSALANTNTSSAWVSGISDSTGSANVGSSSLSWDVGSWGGCSAATPACGTTSSGFQYRQVDCRAVPLDGTGAVTISASYCSAVASLGSMPSSANSCAVTGPACPPPPGPTYVYRYGSVSIVQFDACWSTCITGAIDCRNHTNPSYWWDSSRYGNGFNVGNYSVTLPGSLHYGGQKTFRGVRSLSHSPAASCPAGYRQQDYQVSSGQTPTAAGNCPAGVYGRGYFQTRRTCVRN